MEIVITAYNNKTNTLFQFYDDYNFGHPNYNYTNSQHIKTNKIMYLKTLEKEKIITIYIVYTFTIRYEMISIV